MRKSEIRNPKSETNPKALNQGATTFRLLLPNDVWVRALLPSVLVFLAACMDRNYQTDFWHHLARGRVMVEQGALVNHDLFTFTVPGKEFQDANWLTQLLYYVLFRAGGFPLVQMVNGLILALTMALLAWLCWYRSRSWILAAGMGAITVIGLWQLLLIRPQTFSFFLFVLLYIVLELAQQHRGLLIVAPLLLALWVNMHGAFPIGLVLIGCYFLAALWEAGRQRG